MSHPLFPFGTPPKAAKPKPKPPQTPRSSKGSRYYPFQRHQQAASQYSVEQLLDEFRMTPGEWEDTRRSVDVLYFQANL